MKPLRQRLKEEVSSKKVTQHVIEKDYALSYILAGISKHPTLTKALIFKGGTALKKIFFGDYRFSEDLDFSVQNAPKRAALENALAESILTASNLLQPFGQFTIELKRNPESAPHPQGQEAFVVLVKFPWQPTALCRIKIEVTHDELVLMPPIYYPIIHNYEEKLDCAIACYTIEEIIAEKMRALLQTHQRLVIRGWNKPRARDYYDLWRILKNSGDKLNTKQLLSLVKQKSDYRNVSYKNVDDFFTEKLLSETAQHWQNTLGTMVLDLPPCEVVIEETKVLVAKLFSKILDFN